jgi:hypothetical protein
MNPPRPAIPEDIDALADERLNDLLDGLLHQAPDDDVADAMAGDVAGRVMNVLRAEAAADGSGGQALADPLPLVAERGFGVEPDHEEDGNTSTRRLRIDRHALREASRTWFGWSKATSLVAAAALSAGVTLLIAGAAGVKAKHSPLASQPTIDETPNLAVAGPSELVEPATPAGHLQVDLPVNVVRDVVASIDITFASNGIVAFSNTPAAASAADAAKADAGVSGVTAPFASLASSLPRQNPSRRLVVAASEQESLDNLPVEMDSAPTALVE